MLKDFIEEYKAAYELSFGDDFRGKFDEFTAQISEPKFHPSAELLARLRFLSSILRCGAKIAVLGQFSSGKSSFLNALIGENILPTGVVPVTAKPTYIAFAPTLSFKAIYEDGSEEFISASELKNFVDQREFLQSVKYLSIGVPNKLLKRVSFIDTPGLNSRSTADTQETLDVIKNASGLIWISLIDNAARKSEKDELNSLPSELRATSICLLNQKDKLNADEILRVLEHAKITYDNYFGAVIPISAKMHLNGGDDDGFDAVFDFIDQIVQKNDEFVAKSCENILLSLKKQESRTIEILSELENIFENFDEIVNSRFIDLESEYKNEFALLFGELKQNAALIASEISDNLHTQKGEYFREKKGVLGKTYEKISYEKIELNADGALSKLIYNDERIAKIFTKFKRELATLNSHVRADLDVVFNELKTSILRYKAKYESLRKSDILHSDVLFADIRQFSSQAYFLFVNEFEQSLARKYADLGLFFEKISIKIAVNYQNAIKLAVHFIDDKIKKSVVDYESDPSAFSLYFPQALEISERVLSELSYYEFEDDFIGSRPFISKFLDKLKDDFSALKCENIKRIEALKNRHYETITELEKISIPK